MYVMLVHACIYNIYVVLLPNLGSPIKFQLEFPLSRFKVDIACGILFFVVILQVCVL